MQVEPMKPVLKAPGSKRLKLKHDWPLSKFAFNFNSRRYSEAERFTSNLDKYLISSMSKVRRCRWNR